MALDEEPDAPGTYSAELARDQQAGSFWRCSCGEFNPATYDTCHFCQKGSPVPPPVTGVGQAFTPGPDDMEDSFGGVLVSSLGEDGDAIALTGEKNKALESLDSYYRVVCGQPNLLDDATRPLTDAYYFLNSGYAVFTRTTDGGWRVDQARPAEPGALPVTWFEGSPGPVPEPYERRNDPQIPNLW